MPSVPSTAGYSSITLTIVGVGAAILTAGGIASVTIYVFSGERKRRRRGVGKEDMEMLDPVNPAD